MSELANIKQVRFLLCPHCSAEHRVEHLYGVGRFKSTTWYCNCGKAIDIELKDGELYASINPTKFKKPALTLLRLRDHAPVYLVISDSVWDFDPLSEGKPYRYNEGTCPTNYLRDAKKIIEGNDTDPHGIFEFVALREFEGDLDSNISVEELAALFRVPEIAKPLLGPTREET